MELVKATAAVDVIRPLPKGPFDISESWDRVDGIWQFTHTVVYVGNTVDHTVFARTLKRKCEVQDSNIATLGLDFQPIDPRHICPTFDPTRMTIASPASLAQAFIKVPRPCFYDIDCPDLDRQLLEEEIMMYELLRRGPSHPNVARYHGVVIAGDSDLVLGLVLDQYQMTLKERVENSSTLGKIDVVETIRGMRMGVEHLHRMGVQHNDLSVHNVMVAEEDRPVIVDFDSACPLGGQSRKQPTAVERQGPGEADWKAVAVIEEFLRTEGPKYPSLEGQE